jgi:oxygen-independent coproporphyrinogen-3 oxidase
MKSDRPVVQRTQPATSGGIRPSAVFDGLYVHVPFCVRKCAYCAFYSLPGSSPDTRRRYLQRLDAELGREASRLRGVRTVFVGGGTPTLLEPAELLSLLGSIRRHSDPAPDAEFSVECNPESLSPDRVSVLTGAGVNRVSVGVQSFEQTLRQTLGRGGEVTDIVRGMEMLRKAGIDNLGADLIYAIPGQTLSDLERDVRRVCELGVKHLSAYELTVEEGTRLARNGPAQIDPDLAVDMWRTVARVAQEYGLRRYEVSNLAVPGYECRHNLAVWHGAGYLGCGPAAASFDGRLRWTQVPELEAWLAGAEPDYDELPPDRRAAEILGFGLRTVEGWDAPTFRDCTGFDPYTLRGPVLEDLERAGLIHTNAHRLAPTEQGLLFADTIAAELL